MHNPGRSHWNAIKHVFRYLVGTKDHGILFGLNKNKDVVGYTDPDFVGCVDSRKSTTGYCVKFGNGAISWKSKLQECMATSTTKAEYVAVSDMTKEGLGFSCLQRQSGYCRSVEKSSSPQRLRAYRCSVSLRSVLRHFRENRPGEYIYSR